MRIKESQLAELVRRLEAERGMGRKVRLLAGSWPALRELSPEQRERVAVAVGSRWAWDNLEGLFGKPEEMSQNQLQAKAVFDKMRNADPAELRELGRKIKQGDGSGARSRLLEALGDALEEEIAGRHDPEPAGHLVEETAEPEVRGPMSAAPPPPPPWLPPSLLEQLDGPAPSDDPDGGDRTPPASTRGEVSEPGELGVDPTRGTSAKPETADTAARETSRQEPEHGSLEAGDEVEQVEEESGDVLEDAPVGRRRRDVATLSAVESFRTLRRMSIGEAAPSRAGRAALVGSLGSGWAARRAVSAMIRSHLVADLEEALALIQGLPAVTQRAWCLGDLLQHWQLDHDARERVLAAAPTNAARSRLERRAAREVT